MLRRFSLYGFLKNQRYYEPFLVLALLSKGLTFFQIGLLIGVREVAVNLLEIPSGAVADVYGRRRAMIFSFCAYIVSFLLLGASSSLALLAVAMLIFGAGEAFRSGTHKAMIFQWLRSEGRESERTQTYGYTRSWSKFGSAASVVVAAGLVVALGRYDLIFYASAIPYVLGIVNFLGYPAALEGDRRDEVSLAQVLRVTKVSLLAALREAGLRRLILESMGFEGVFKAAKDYLQPVLQSAAIPLFAVLYAGVALDEPRRVALLVGPVYFVLYLLSGVASRHAHRLAGGAAREEGAAQRLWVVYLGTFALLIPAMFLGVHAVMIAGFVVLTILQNLWRPLLISRVDACSDERQGATVLSIENQARSVATMVLAPLFGFAVDTVRRGSGADAASFWPVGVLGLGVALLLLVLSRVAGRRG